MTHFLIGVVLPPHMKGASEETLYNAVAELLEPFNENTEVEPYEEECWRCKGTGIREDMICNMCDGVGIIESTYNPNSKWDWWRPGGRFDGRVSISGEYRPSTDGGFNFGKGHETIRVHNSCLVSSLKAAARERLTAIVTPDGNWYEEGHVGWWGIISDINPEWKPVINTVLAGFPDCLIVGVDAHI